MLVVTGLGGEPIFTKRFDGWALNLRDVALEKFRIAPQHLAWLASSGHEHSSEEAVRDNVRAILERFNRQASGATTLVVVLIGHGTAQGKEAALTFEAPTFARKTSPNGLLTLRPRPSGCQPGIRQRSFCRITVCAAACDYHGHC